MIAKKISRLSLFLAWLIALLATLSTLYASEIIKLPVCHLCWYQRICIYPLAIILGIAVFRDDCRIGIYTIPLTIIGAIFAGYQYALQILPAFGPIHFCTIGPDCRMTYFQFFGFITLPFLSLTACIAMLILLILAYYSE